MSNVNATNSNANSMQFGGNHYKKGGKIDHWDWVERNCIPYTLGCASKYFFRYRDKGNPVLDLQKSIHYFTKAKELAEDGVIVPGASRVVEIGAHEIAAIYQLDQDQRELTNIVLYWEGPADLQDAIDRLQRMLAELPVA